MSDPGQSTLAAPSPGKGDTEVYERQRRKVLVGGGSFALVDATGKLLAFAVVAVLTRRQSAHTFGLVVAGIAGASIVQTVVDGGLGMALAAAVARRQRSVRTIAGSRILLATAVALPATAGMLVLPFPAALWAACLACGATSAVLPVPALVAVHRLGYASLALVGPNVLFLCVVFFLPPASAAEILGVFGACNAACAVVTLGIAEIRPTPVSLPTACRTYRRYIANAVYVAATTVYGRLDTVFLAVIGQATEAGLYGTYYRMVLAVVGLASWLSPLAFPLLADTRTFRERVIWLQARLLAIAITVSLILLLAGPSVLSILTHGGHLPVLASASIALIAVPTILSTSLGAALIVNERTRSLAEICLAVLLLACVLYAALIPSFGVDGAAVASLLTEVVALALLWCETVLFPPKSTARSFASRTIAVLRGQGGDGHLARGWPKPRRGVAPLAGPLASAGLGLVAGATVARGGDAGIALLAVVGLTMILLCWLGGRARRERNTRAVTFVCALYLCPLFMFGRVFALIGHNPVYVPDALLLVALLIMLPVSYDALRRLAPLPLLCIAVALLALHAVYVGMSHGYPTALKASVLAFYPVAGLITAAWLCATGEADRILSLLPRYVLPLVTPGLAVVIASGASLIPASYGLYLGIAAAFAASPGVPRRRLLAFTTLVGAGLVIADTGERGTALTILIAPLAAWLAARRSRSGFQTWLTASGVLTGVTVLALVVSLGAISPTRLPVVGQVIGRASGQSVSATNNVGLRKAMWSYALRTTYSENPLLGVGAYHPINVDYQGNNIAKQGASGVHNSFVGYTFYAGFPAGILVVILFGMGVWRSWRIRRTSIYAPAMFGALIAVVLTAFTNVALETTYIGGPSWIVLGAALALAANRTSSLTEAPADLARAPTSSSACERPQTGSCDALGACDYDPVCLRASSNSLRPSTDGPAVRDRPTMPINQPAQEPPSALDG